MKYVFLAVNLTQLPTKSIMMDIVVADIPPKFGLLLSRSWSKRLGSTLQMDLTYATMPLFRGETKRLYGENQLAYIISKESHSMNHPIYTVDTDFGSCILQIDDNQQTSVQLTGPTHSQPKEVTTMIWTMYFDGASAQNLVGTGVMFISPSKENIHL